MNVRYTLFLAASLATSEFAFAQVKVIPAQSQITFVAKEMGVPVEGKFGSWTADITFDPKHPEAGKVNFAINTASASFGAKETDEEVPKSAWFNVAKFPVATFASSAIKAKGGTLYDVSGKLTVKGITKDVVVPITLSLAGSTTTAIGAFSVRRNDFKIGEGEWTDTSQLADEVLVKFKISLSSASAGAR